MSPSATNSMFATIDVSRTLVQILAVLNKLESQMAAVPADIQALTAIVTAEQASLVTLQANSAAVLAQLQSITSGDSLTPTDQAALEAAIASLGNVNTGIGTVNTNLGAAVAPPAPTPTN